MGFIMDGLDAEAYDRSYSDRDLVQRIFHYFRAHARVMLFAAVMIVFNALLDAVSPLLLAHGVDIIFSARNTQALVVLLGIILLAGLLSWGCNAFRQWYTARVIGNVVMQVRLDAFAAVMARDMSFYDEFPSGKIVSRVTSDTEAFAQVVTLTLNLVSQVLFVLVLTVALLYTNLRLAALTLVIVPLIVVAALSFRHLARRAVQRAQRAQARVNNVVQEAMSGITVAKNFRQEGTMYREFREINDQRYHVNLRTGFVFSAIFPVLVTIAGLGTVIVLYFGGMSVLDGAVSAGTWFLFIQTIEIFWFPLTSIASFWSQFQQGLGAAERIFALIDAEPRVQQSDARRLPRLAGRIEFRDLDFRYSVQESVLHGFNLTIPAGQTIALVGHTGAGKSTLGKLVARFYEFQHGALLIDGLDSRTFDLQHYRRQLGIVGQVPFLFSGTVADNIRYARPQASDAEVEAVARRVGGGDWLAVLPQGLETECGEQGRGLSLGQRQLVALARVLLQDPAIVILDEATASVDPLTEAEIQEGLNEVLRDRTAIVIAHRLSTIVHADRIVVLRQGEIVEEGSHHQLMAQGGHYAQLYNMYFRHQSPDYRPGEGFIPVGALG